MPDAELLRALQPLLEPREIAVVTQALGLDDEQAQNRCFVPGPAGIPYLPRRTSLTPAQR